MEKAKHITLFDNLEYFDQTNKQLRDRNVVKELMKNTEYDDTVMIVFKLLASLQNYKAKLTYAIELLKKGEVDVSKIGTDSDKKFSNLKQEYDDTLTEFFNIIEERREKDLVQLLTLIDETVSDVKADDIAQMKNFNLFNKHQPNPNEEDVKIIETDSKSYNCKVKFQIDSISKRKPLKIIHFNDVYNIDEKQTEPVSGYSRFNTALRSFDNIKPLILFSGDIFAPSKLSIFFEGEHMMPFVKKAGIHCACVGNHDFDYGDQKLGSLISRTDFPWLLSNLKRANTGEMLSNTVEHVVLEHEGYKIAIIGIAEVEWIEALNTLDMKELEFEKPVD